MPSGTDERSQKRTSGVHRKGWARVYCNNRRKPWPRQGKNHTQRRSRVRRNHRVLLPAG